MSDREYLDLSRKLNRDAFLRWLLPRRLWRSANCADAVEGFRKEHWHYYAELGPLTVVICDTWHFFIEVGRSYRQIAIGPFCIWLDREPAK